MKLDPSSLSVAERSAWQNGYEEGLERAVGVVLDYLEGSAPFLGSISQSLEDRIKALIRE